MKKESFEDKLAKLEEIIAMLEDDDTALDTSIENYAKAMKLIKEASEILNEAEGKLKLVRLENDEIKVDETDEE